jgi:hypothetical protein
MSAYADIDAGDVPELLTIGDIDRLFKREPGWFARQRTQRRLYAKGFPHPCDRGRWSPLAVKTWMEGAGTNPDNVPPAIKRGRPRPRRSSRSGYASP